jgi:hypothetical protein
MLWAWETWKNTGPQSQTKIKAAFGEDKLILKGADSVIYHNLYD